MRTIKATDFRMGQIESFLITARFESLTKASEFLHISVSALSKNIKNLETELGLILFIREKNKLILTPAGKELCADFSSAVNQIQNAVERAHQIQRAEMSRPFFLGLTEQMDPEDHLIPALESYIQVHTDFEYYLDFYPSSVLPQKLLSGEIDFASVFLYESEKYSRIEELDYHLVNEIPLCIDVMNDHPLASMEQVSFDDLRYFPFVVPSPSLETGFEKNLFQPLCMKYGFTPMIHHYASTMKGMVFHHVKEDIVLTDKTWIKAENKKRIPIIDEYTGFCLAWKKGSLVSNPELIKEILSYWEGY